MIGTGASGKVLTGWDVYVQGNARTSYGEDVE